MPAAGYYQISDFFPKDAVGNMGFYWSSTIKGNDPTSYLAHDYVFYDYYVDNTYKDVAGLAALWRAAGIPIRPVKNN